MGRSPGSTPQFQLELECEISQNPPVVRVRSLIAPLLIAQSQGPAGPRPERTRCCVSGGRAPVLPLGEKRAEAGEEGSCLRHCEGQPCDPHVGHQPEGRYLQQTATPAGGSRQRTGQAGVVHIAAPSQDPGLELFPQFRLQGSRRAVLCPTGVTYPPPQPCDLTQGA